MAERKEEADRDRPLPFLHQLAGHIVDGGDMIGVERVAQTEGVGEHRRAEQDRVVAKRRKGPKPGGDIRPDQQDVHADRLRSQVAALIVEKARQKVAHFCPCRPLNEDLNLDFRMGMRVRAPARRPAVSVRRRVDRHGNETDLTVRDAAFGDDRFRKLAHRGGVAPKHRDFEAAVVIEMDVHRRDLMTVMVVVRIGQPLGQLARVVIEDVGEGRHAVPGDIAIDARPLEAKTREIAHRLRAIVIALAFHERGQLGREFVGHADRDPLHGDVFSSDRRDVRRFGANIIQSSRRRATLRGPRVWYEIESARVDGENGSRRDRDWPEFQPRKRTYGRSRLPCARTSLPGDVSRAQAARKSTGCGAMALCANIRTGRSCSKPAKIAPGMFVVLKGLGVGHPARRAWATSSPMVEQGAGQFLADVGQLSTRAALVDATAEGDVETLLIPPDGLRALLVAENELGERIMRALILRRVALLQGARGRHPDRTAGRGGRDPARGLSYQERLSPAFARSGHATLKRKR